MQCTVIVAAGKTVDQIKMMHVMEKQKHAEACNKNRSISATSNPEAAERGERRDSEAIERRAPSPRHVASALPLAVPLCPA